MFQCSQFHFNRSYLHFTFAIHTNYLHFHFDYPFAYIGRYSHSRTFAIDIERLSHWILWFWLWLWLSRHTRLRKENSTQKKQWRWQTDETKWKWIHHVSELKSCSNFNSSAQTMHSDAKCRRNETRWTKDQREERDEECVCVYER